MAIVLKYGAPGPILLAGAAGGRGHRENEDQDDALKLWQQQQQQNFQSRQLSQQQGFVAGQAFLDRKYRTELQKAQFGEAKTERDFRAGQQKTAQDFQAGQQKGVLQARAGESALDREQRALLEKQRNEFVNDQNTLTGLRRCELELPQAAQKRLDQLEAGRVDAMKLAPAEQQEFQTKYEAEKRQLLRLSRPTNETPYDERLKKNLGANYDQYKNLPWQFNNQGEMSLPTGFKFPGDNQAESEQKFNEAVMKRYEKNLTELDETDGEKPLYADKDGKLDENAALQAAIDQQNTIERGRQRLVGRGTQQPATVQGSGDGAAFQASAAEGQRAQAQAISAAAGRPQPQAASQLTPAQQPVTQTSLTPGQQAEIDRLRRIGQPPTPAQIDFQQQMAAFGQQEARRLGKLSSAPAGGSVLKADSLPAATRSQLPRINTKEEAAAFRAKHGSGVPFEGPDGQVYHTN